MKKLFSNSYLVISLYLLFSFLIDIMTNLSINLSFSIGIFLRGILFFFLITGLLVKYKDKKNYIIIGSIGLFSLIHLIVNGLNLDNLINISKYSYFLVILTFLYNLYKCEDKKINRNIITLCLLFYSLSIIFAWLINFNISNPVFGSTTKLGLFQTSNEISTIISIILPYIFINLTKRINFIEIFTILTSLFASILLGTRLPIIVFLFCLLYFLIKKLIKDIRNKKIDYINIILFIIFLVVFILKFKATPLYKNIVNNYKSLNIINPFEIFKDFKTFDKFVFNNRLTYLTNINHEILSSQILNKLFGLRKITKLVEMDLYDIFYGFGIIGFIIYIFVVSHVLNSIKSNNKKVNYLPLIYIIVISFISGHVLLSPNVALIAGVITANTLYKKKRKKVLFAAYDLGPGGIEKALVNMCKRLNTKNYDQTIYLERKEGIFLSEIPENIEIKTQKVWNIKFKLINKFLNMLNKLKFLITNFKEYDFSCCYATYSLSSNFISRYSSNNCAIYIHNDYAKLYENNIKELNSFFTKRKLDKFKHIVFVSNESKENLLSIYPRFIDKSIVINNFIDNKRYIELSNKPIKETKPKTKKLFLYVGRLDDAQKNLKLMINSFKNALEQNNKIELWIIGSGPDEKMVKDLISKNKLEKNIKLLGTKANPYPYFKMCDYFLLTSNYEGFPVVYGEAITFKKKIITTVNVSDEAISIDNNFGYVCYKNEKDVANAIVKVSLNDNLKYKSIDIDEVNENKLKLIEKLINKG